MHRTDPAWPLIATWHQARGLILVAGQGRPVPLRHGEGQTWARSSASVGREGLPSKLCEGGFRGLFPMWAAQGLRRGFQLFDGGTLRGLSEEMEAVWDVQIGSNRLKSWWQLRSPPGTCQAESSQSTWVVSLVSLSCMLPLWARGPRRFRSKGRWAAISHVFALFGRQLVRRWLQLSGYPCGLSCTA